MTTLEQRVSRLEGGYEHLATKADLADLRADLKTDISRLESEFGKLEVRLLRWMIAMVMTSIIVATSVATFIQGFVD